MTNIESTIKKIDPAFDTSKFLTEIYNSWKNYDSASKKIDKIPLSIEKWLFADIKDTLVLPEPKFKAEDIVICGSTTYIIKKYDSACHRYEALNLMQNTNAYLLVENQNLLTKIGTTGKSADLEHADVKPVEKKIPVVTTPASGIQIRTKKLDVIDYMEKVMKLDPTIVEKLRNLTLDAIFHMKNDGTVAKDLIAAAYIFRQLYKLYVEDLSSVNLTDPNFMQSYANLCGAIKNWIIDRKKLDTSDKNMWNTIFSDEFKQMIEKMIPAVYL